MSARLTVGFARRACCLGLALATLIAIPSTVRAGDQVPSNPAGPLQHPPELEPTLDPHRDPLVAMVRRVDRFLWRNSVGGVTPDSRWNLNPTETARLTAICQLLGYAELNSVVPRERFRTTIGLCADTLLGRFAEVRSGTVFDGMLGYAMLKAYETIGDPRYLTAAEDVIAELTAISRSEYVLNGGLMAAMAFAEHYKVTGNTDSEDLARYVLAGEPAYQHADGCFPHWCWCTRDISYTDWMSMELILIQRAMDDPNIDPILAGTLAFMEGRIDDEGHTSYEASCPDYPGCTIEYWSLGSGCGIDTETRGFTNEPAYTALLFDHFHAPKYDAVLHFLQSIESNGTWADQWDYFVPPSDPYYPWASADTSVINISINFWALAATLSGRSDPSAIEQEWASGETNDALALKPDRPALRSTPAGHPGPRASTVPSVSRMQVAPPEVVNTCDGQSSPPAIGANPPPAPEVTITAIAPNPSPSEFNIALTARVASAVTLSIYDSAGRRVRTLIEGEVARGAHSVDWDGRDDAGRKCGGGVYFAALRPARRDPQVVRLLLVR